MDFEVSASQNIDALEFVCPRARCRKKIYVKMLDTNRVVVYNATNGEQMARI